MEFRQLKYFIAIADHGSLAKAAGQLCVAPSALSQQLRQLEEDLGTPIFHRSSSGVSLTDSGKLFYEHAKAILRQVDESRAALRQSRESPIGTVELGLPASASSTLALPIFMATRERLPRVKLKISEELTGVLAEQLRLGRLHLAVLFDDEQLEEVRHRRIVEEPLALIRTPGREPPPRRMRFAEALEVPLILPSIEHGVRRGIERCASARGVHVKNLVAEINSSSILKSAILAGLGATLQSRAMFREELAHNQLCAISVDDPVITRTLAVCASRKTPLSLASQAVARLIGDVVHALNRSGEWPCATPIDDPEESWL